MQRALDPGAGLAQAMDQGRLGQRPVDRVARVQRAIGVLEHHLDLAAEALAAALALRFAGERDPPLPAPQQARDRLQHRRFAGARFADQTERLAFADLGTRHHRPR